MNREWTVCIIFLVVLICSPPTRGRPRRSLLAPPRPRDNNFDYSTQSAVDLSSSSLSIMGPLEVLRQSMAAEIYRYRIRQAMRRQMATNSEYIQRIGR